MFVQIEKTPNPNTLKFLPGKKVSEVGPIEYVKKSDSKNELIRNIFSINGTNMVFLGADFITVKKEEKIVWEDIQHIIVSFINEHYLAGKENVLDKVEFLQKDTVSKNEIEKKINEILETKIRPAVARDGGDIKFKSFKDGLVTVELRGSCSGCPSSTLTLKQGVQNLLCHYIPEVKSVEAL
tara:strand:+ start:16 stop:561 length:546 start_codon:yes stop_codon:yes gene_type:complete